MTLRNDYSGPLDPDLTLADFSREFLVRLDHEYLLIGHLLDRVGRPLVAIEHGVDGYVRSGTEPGVKLMYHDIEPCREGLGAACAAARSRPPESW